MLFYLKNKLSHGLNQIWSGPRERKKQLNIFNKSALELTPPATDGPGNKNTWLIVKVDDIGDIALFTPSFNAFCENAYLNGQKVYALVNEVCKPLLDELCYSCTFIWFNKSLWFNSSEYRKSLVLKLNNLNFGNIAFASYTRVPLLEGLLSLPFLNKNIFAWQRISEPFDNPQLIEKLNSGNILSRKNNLHELELNAVFFQWISGKTLAIKQGLLLKEPSIPLIQNLPYVIVCPGGNQKSKQYAAYKYHLAIKKLSETFPQLHWVIVGGSSDAALGSIIIKNISNAVNLCGKTSVLELAQICSQAALYIGNDTGAAHLSALQNTPCLVLLNGNRYGRFFPYPSQFKFVKTLYTPQFTKINPKPYNYPSKTSLHQIKWQEIARIAQEMLS